MGVSDVRKVTVWGNHSASQYPDITHATVRGQAAAGVVDDPAWVADVFIPTVAKRGAAIIDARGASSAASAANAAIDHVHDWVLGTNGKWVTMGIPSDGSYGIPKDVMYGFAVTCADGEYTMVRDLTVDEYSRTMMDKTLAELEEERAGVAHLLG